MREGLQKIVALDETVVAISTPSGRSALGMVRVTGPQATRLVESLFRSTQPLEHRRACVGLWLDPNGCPVDEVVVTMWHAPHSYTGEDLVEVSAHGNPFILNRIVSSVVEVGGRRAMPGEFTLRAVANGKMDLVQAEAVRDFIEAQTTQQAKIAFRQIEGSASKRLSPLKDALANIIARLEAGIDFAEDDVEIPHPAKISREIETLGQMLQTVKQTFGYGQMLFQGLRVTILGKPNVGKSSLFNRLLESERAIVTEIPGTTRDVVTETLTVEGVPLRLADTAGLRETVDPVESIGVSKSMEVLAEADLTLVVLDGSRPMDADDVKVLQKTASLPRFVVINKCDLPTALECDLNGTKPLPVSAITGTGLAELRIAIRDFVGTRQPPCSEDFVVTNSRQYDAIGHAADCLMSAGQAISYGAPQEIVLLDLYAALSALSEMTGEVVTDDILDRIFSTFCVGK